MDRMVGCVACGRQIIDGALLCQWCGSKQNVMSVRSAQPVATPGTFCSGCGCQLDAAARFCSACGAPRPAPPSVVTMSTTVSAPRRPSGGGPALAIKAVGGAAAMVMVVSYLAYDRDDDESSASSDLVDTTRVRDTHSQETEMSPAEQLARRLSAAASLDEALAIARPSMGDSHDDVNSGTAMMALWAAAHLRLDQVRVERNETSIKAILKDPDSERGKRMCVKGSVGQIGKDDSVPDAPIFVGQIRTTSWDFVRFYAAGSTAGIVEDTRTRFCGVVTGRYSFSNAMGGTTHTAELVGMFDIPANRPAPPVVEKSGPPPGVSCLDPKQYTEYGAADLGLPLCRRATSKPPKRATHEQQADAPAPASEPSEPPPAPAEAGEGPIDPFAGEPE